MVEKNADGSHSVSETENSCISSNDMNSLSDGSTQPTNNNNNTSPSKLGSKSASDFSFDDKNQTEDEVQKLMSIALSNNQKRLERACLNATDKPSLNRLPSTDSVHKNVEKSIEEDPDNNQQLAEKSLSKEVEKVEEEENMNHVDKEIKIDNETDDKDVPIEKVESKNEMNEDEKEKDSKFDESKSEFCVPEGKNEFIVENSAFKTPCLFPLRSL